MAWLVQPDMLFRLGLLLVIALYLRTLTFDFVYDDLFIPINPWIHSWHGVLDAFRNDIWGFDTQAATSYYRPISVALGVVIARLTPGTPGWFHFTALAIEAVLCVACYAFARRIFRDEWLAALTTVLFILHPTKVETVAWIGSAECDGVAAIFLFASFTCYLRSREDRGARWICASLAAFACAIFTKETMIVLPLLIGLHTWLHSERGTRLRRAAMLMVPYAVVAGLFLLARRAALKPVAASRNAVQATFTLANLWSAPAAFWWYAKRLVFPFGLSILYDPLAVHHFSVRSFLLPLLAGLVLAVVVFWAWRRTRSPQIPFWSAWLLLTLGPPIALSPQVTVHDRYLQLAALPFCAVIAWGVLKVGRSRSHLLGRWLAVAMSVCLIAGWSLATWHESGFWDNNLLLWQRAVQIAPRNVNARVELARLYAATNPTAGVALLDDGLRLLPNSPGLWRTRGLMEYNLGHYEEAKASLLRSLEASAQVAQEIGSEPPDVKYGRATAAFVLGEIEMIDGKPDAADPWLRKALAIQPDNLDYARVMLANLKKEGRQDEAEEYAKKVEDLVARTRMK
jgi:hypothetical protein